ncbi:hypothetical protein ACVWY2_007096 [Bradyrhizobium sp. JR6.1]
MPQVFYIDNSTTGTSLNLGTQHDPYTSIAAFNAANPAGSGDYVVLEHGTGTYSEANGINLASGVNLIGGSHTLTFTNPVTNAAVTANVGSGTDPVIHVTGADNGIDLLGTSGHTITGVSIDTSASTGIGISDDGNNVGTVTMSDITVKTASGAGLSFTHGGTITVTGSNNTITSTTGTALDVEHTNIGADNLTFKSISATGSSGNAGIILDTTGTAGGLTVTGTGSAGSGGTINNKTGGDILSGTDAGGQTTSGDGGTGIFLHNTANVSLTDMTLHDFSNFAIYGNGVTNFTLANSAISGTNGTTNAGDREESSIRFDNLLGTASITGSSISGGFTQNVDLYNTSGTLNRLTMDSDTFGLIGSSGNDNVLGQVYNSATANYTVTNSTFSGTRSDFIAFAANNNSSMDAVVRSNTFHNGQAIVPGGGTAVDIRSGSGGNVSAATTTFDISHNILTDGGANAFDTVGIFVAKGQDNGTMSGTIASNDIGPAKVGSNSDGIFVRDAGAGSLTTLIQNNTITGVGDAGIALQNNDGSSTLNATLYGNSVSSPTSNSPFAALDVENGATATDTSTTNVVIGMGAGGTGSKNTLNHSTLYATDVELSNFGASTHLNLSKNGSTSGTAAGVITDDNTSTTGGITVDTTGGNGTTTLVGTLPALPAVVAPLLAEAGGVQASTPSTGEMHLTQAELNSAVSAAIADWASAGANATQLALLHAATFSIADLAGADCRSGRRLAYHDRRRCRRPWLVHRPDPVGQFRIHPRRQRRRHRSLDRSVDGGCGSSRSADHRGPRTGSRARPPRLRFAIRCQQPDVYRHRRRRAPACHYFGCRPIQCGPAKGDAHARHLNLEPANRHFADHRYAQGDRRRQLRLLVIDPDAVADQHKPRGCGHEHADFIRSVQRAVQCRDAMVGRPRGGLCRHGRQPDRSSPDPSRSGGLIERREQRLPERSGRRCDSVAPHSHRSLWRSERHRNDICASRSQTKNHETSAIV